MSIKTKQMAVRDKQYPYVNTDNTLQGTMNPLKLFFCKHGVTIDAVTPANSIVYSTVGDFHFKDTDLALLDDERIHHVGTSGFFKNSDPDAYTTALGTIAATTDVLIVMGSQPKASNGNINVRIRDDSGINVTDLKCDGGRTTGTGRSSITDDNATTITAAAAPLSLVLATDYCVATAFDRTANTMVTYASDGAVGASNTATTSDDISTITEALPYVDEPAMLVNAEYYAMALFVFPSGTLPSNWQEKANWMAFNWVNGDFVFPPEWAEL